MRRFVPDRAGVRVRHGGVLAVDHHAQLVVDAQLLQAGSIKKIAVLGVAAKNAGVRRTYEDRFVEVLKHMKYDAEQSYHFLPDISPGDTLALHTALEQHGFTHVPCTRLIDQKTVETYRIPPTVTSCMATLPCIPATTAATARTTRRATATRWIPVTSRTIWS